MKSDVLIWIKFQSKFILHLHQSYNYNAVLRRKYQYTQVLLLLFLIYLPEYSSHLPSAQLPGPVFRPLLPMNFQRIRLLLQKEHYHLSNDPYFLHNRCSRVYLSSDFKNAVILSSFWPENHIFRQSCLCSKLIFSAATLII